LSLNVQLVSPERILYSGSATAVLCRTVGGGDIAFLTGHAPLIGALATWPVKVETDEGEAIWFAVHGGFVEVSNDNVTLLSDVAELASDIDIARAERARDTAYEVLRMEPEHLDCQAALERAETRLRVAAP
jgi:F-type H+-transporting ATPase subunit epsilon